MIYKIGEFVEMVYVMKCMVDYYINIGLLKVECFVFNYCFYNEEVLKCFYLIEKLKSEGCFFEEIFFLFFIE